MTSSPHYDLIVIGSGSGNSLIDERFAHWRIALVDDAPWFGGTCLNVGCIPTKMYVLPADVAHAPADAARLGVGLEFTGADWPAIRDRIFGRIDPISTGGQQWREDSDNVTVYRSRARFIGPGRLQAGDHELTGDRFVLAAGSRPVLPSIPGLDAALASGRVHTSDDVMRLDALPASLGIIGGGFIAAEFAHVFGALGTDVTWWQRSELLLRQEDTEIAAHFTAAAARRFDLRLHTQVTQVEVTGAGLVVTTVGPDGAHRHEVERLLVATGRTPNGDLLDVTAAGVELDGAGRVMVDEFQRTGVAGVWAMGDVSSPFELKHVANHEMRVVQHNLLAAETGDDLVATDHSFVPHAVFTHPQIASAGCTEQQAIANGIDVASYVQSYADVAYGWAMEDGDNPDGAGLCKLIADRSTGRLIGAHLVGAQASTLIQTLILAMAHDLPVAGLARSMYWIHPALPEVVENALLGLEKEL